MDKFDTSSKAKDGVYQVNMEELSSQSGQSQLESKVEGVTVIFSEPSSITKTKLFSILAILWTGALLVALDGTMLATITSSVAGSFGQFSRIAWVSTTYAMGASISQPLSGHLTDIFGRRSGLMISYALFATGTLLCGVSVYAKTLDMFLAGRVIAGLGGGSLTSIISFVESDLVPLKDRALIEGVGNVVYGSVNALGGFYGGSIAGSIGWQWAFLAQLPVIAVDIVLALFFLRIPVSKHELAVEGQPQLPTKKLTVDYVGCTCVLLTMVFLQLALNDGSNNSSWTSGLVISSFVIAGGSATLLVYWDIQWAIKPVLPFRHLMKRTIAASQLSYFFNSISVAIVIYYVPIYLEIVKGATASESGMRFIPYSIVFGIASCLIGCIVKCLGRYYHANLFVQACTLAGTACICSLTAATPSWNTYVYLAISGVGYGGAYVTRLMGLLSSADKDQQAVLQAASWTINSSGNSIGIAVASSVFRNLYVGPLTSLLQNGNQSVLASLLEGSFQNMDLLPGDLKGEVIQIYLQAIRATFYVALGFAVLASGSSLFMEDNCI